MSKNKQLDHQAENMHHGLLQILHPDELDGVISPNNCPLHYIQPFTGMCR